MLNQQLNNAKQLHSNVLLLLPNAKLHHSKLVTHNLNKVMLNQQLNNKLLLQLRNKQPTLLLKLKRLTNISIRKFLRLTLTKICKVMKKYLSKTYLLAPFLGASFFYTLFTYKQLQKQKKH